MTDKLIEALIEDPMASISKLAERVYAPGDPKGSNKVRSLIAALKNQQRLVRAEAGAWQVVK